MQLDEELIRVIVAISMIVGLSVYLSLFTVVGTLKGHDKILGWLAWITLWAVLIFSALEIKYPSAIVFVFAGLVVYFANRVSLKDSKKERGNGSGHNETEPGV